MSYRLPRKVKEYTDTAECQLWFRKSLRISIKDSRNNNYNLYELYEERYNVKVIFHKKLGFVKQIEFPSKHDALIFVIKWS